MQNPWREIELEEYENHMSDKSVLQMQAINKMMQEQLYTYPAESVMILGVAGGNGLEHIKKPVFKKVYGVDINENFLEECHERYTYLNPILETIAADLTEEKVELPYADLVIANLFVEFIGYEKFRHAVEVIQPRYVSCIIQKDTGETFVSESPYIHTLESLESVHHTMEEGVLEQTMNSVGYRKVLHSENRMPNGKALVRVDFTTAE